MTGPYMSWKVCDVMNNAKARAWFFPYFREHFPPLQAYAGTSRAGWLEALRLFGGVKDLHSCELSVRELYDRIKEWSPGGVYYGEEE